MRTLIFITSVFFSMLSFASDNWVGITMTNKSVYSFDPDRVDRVNYLGKSYYKTWIREEELSQFKGQEGKLTGIKNMVLYYLDCPNNQLAIKSATKFKNGEPLKGNSFNLEVVDFQDAIPSSVADEIIRYSCMGK